MLAQTSTVDLAAPLDIAWVWHVHMLSPLSYERDCNRVVSTIVDHRILVEERREKGLRRAKLLWSEMYPEEPFEVDLKTAVTEGAFFESRIHYDIAKACTRQRVFYYQVSLPHYGDKKFLKKAVQRYKQHLLLKQKHQEAFLVPCYDFDLIWHAHQVHPLIYRNDTIRVLGKVLKHDDSVNDRQPGSQLTISDRSTRERWTHSGEKFEVNGAMFRGEPPLNSHHEMVDYSSMAALQYTLELIRLEVKGLPKPKSYTVKIDVVNGNKVIKKQVKGPAARVLLPPKALPTFTFNTKKNKALKVRY